MTDKRLHQLLDLYYDGRTTLRQERILRRQLADYQGADCDLVAARAVMAFAIVEGRSRQANRVSRSRYLVAAASVVAAIALAAGLWFAVPRTADSPECYAVLSGRYIDDAATALSLMDSQLADIGSATEGVSDAVSSDLQLFGDFFQ